MRDARTKEPLPRVQVKVKGSDNPEFFSGETDLRGVFVAEGIAGQVTAVARQSTTAYAFYRGTGYVGQPPMPKPEQQGQWQGQAPAKTLANQAGQEGQNASNAPMLNQALDANLRMQNTSNNLKQIQRLEERYRAPAPSHPKGAAAGEFH